MSMQIQKPYIQKTAYVSETYDLPKFPLKRHLSNGIWTRALAPPTSAKNRKKP